MPQSIASPRADRPYCNLATHRPEITSAQEGNDVALQVGVEVDAEASEAEILRQALVLQAALAIIEHRGIVSQFLRLAVHHLIHPNRPL